MKKGRPVRKNWSGGPIPQPKNKFSFRYSQETLKRMAEARVIANEDRAARGLPLLRDDEIPPHPGPLTVDQAVHMARAMLGLPTKR